MVRFTMAKTNHFKSCDISFLSSKPQHRKCNYIFCFIYFLTSGRVRLDKEKGRKEKERGGDGNEGKLQM